MKDIWKMVPALAPVLAAGGVTAGAAVSLGGYTVPAYNTEEFQIVQEAADVSAQPAEMDTETAEAAAVESIEAEYEVTKGKGSFDLKDGSYEGTGKGYKGDVKVSVEIKERSIDAVHIVSHSDDEAFFNRAKEGVISSILSKQSVDVDTVSGATYSSNGIIHAVKNALTGEEDQGQTAASGGSSGSGLGGSSSGPVTIGQGNLDYADGTYQGSAAGFSGNVTVSVTVKNKTITAINIVSHSDDESFFNRAKEGVINSILSSQKLDVDTVSGATFSSNGIINAVKNALSGAGSAGTQNGNTPAVTPTPTSKPVAATVPGAEAPSGAFPYPDGTYTGSGEGFNGNVIVKVVIENKTIASVDVTEYCDDEAFFSRASALTGEIVKRQSLSVDTVAGATYSSKGILEAVKNALEAAKSPASTGTPVPTVMGGTTPTVTPSPVVTAVPPPTEIEGADRPACKDGIYSAFALCSPDEYWDFDPYNLYVTVVLENGRITAIRNVYGDYDDEAADNDAYVNRAANGNSSAAGVVGQIVEKNSAEEIHAVSHATCSSHAIVEACRQALQKAKE